MRRSYLTRGAAPALAVLLIGLLLASPGAAGNKRNKRYWTRTKSLADGVTLTTINNPRGPYRIKVVTVELAKPSTLDVALATDVLPGWETTSSLSHRYGALVAINGDYGRPSGRPVMTFAQDGYLDQTPLTWGRNFAVDRTETVAHIGHPEVSSWASVPDTGAQYPIERFNNGVADIDELAAFSMAGGREESPSPYSCSARLLQDGYADVGPTGTQWINHVDKVRCANRPLARRGGTVVTTPRGGTREAELTGLLPGEQVNLGWTLGWPAVMDTVGGNPTLIEGGEIVSQNVYGTGTFFQRHPRTGVGSTADGKVLLVTVDGRQKGYSVGMTLGQFAKLFKSLGADYALNLDGGGSTTMVVNGQVVNRPSDGHERAVSSALLLLPGVDPGEPPPQPVPSPTPTSTPILPPVFPPTSVDSAKTWQEVVHDGGSTGGLAQALFREGMRLPRYLKRAAATFSKN